MPPKPSSGSQDLGVVKRAAAWELLAPATPLLALLIIGVGYAFVLRPQFEELRALRERFAATAELVDLQVHVEALAETRRSFDEALVAERAIIDAAVPPGGDQSGLLVALDAAAQRAGVVLASVEFTTEDPPASLPELSGNSVIAGNVTVRDVDYPRLKALLAVLESSQRLIDVTAVQFTPESRSVTVRVKAYGVE